MFHVFIPTSLASFPIGIMLAYIMVCNEFKYYATNIEKTYQKGAPRESNLIEV